MISNTLSNQNKINLLQKSPNLIFLSDYNQTYVSWHFDLARRFAIYKSLKSNKSFEQSKYFELVNSNISRINNLTSFKKNKTKNCPNTLKYHDKYNKTFLNYFNNNTLKAKMAKNSYFKFNTLNDKISKNSRCYLYNKSKQTFYGSTNNNSRTYLDSSTSCSSKTLKYSRRF